MSRKDTAYMTVAKTADYLMAQKEKGWPGSKSIHPGRAAKNAANRKFKKEYLGEKDK